MQSFLCVKAYRHTHRNIYNTHHHCIINIFPSIWLYKFIVFHNDFWGVIKRGWATAQEVVKTTSHNFTCDLRLWWRLNDTPRWSWIHQNMGYNDLYNCMTPAWMAAVASRLPSSGKAHTTRVSHFLVIHSYPLYNWAIFCVRHCFTFLVTEDRNGWEGWGKST